ncbi:hypothetical protein [Sphingomonas sp. SUN039]|uniref:hypothetical protein n=1 Tax=Sphingomonas sp. SUN039 TaxID=2937787 RepID=UPI002164C1E7|nr:hypothetical protein [Sphingomonas sp. SUN039]UVO55191.1 hypothetical protein M0209_14040 [Sphingomonas sp. SUN039]
MTDTAIVRIEGDDEGAFITFPEGFPLPFGADEDVEIEQIGNEYHITRASNVAGRRKYRAKFGLPPGD